MSSSIINPDNSNNPYDSIGGYHNLLLTYFFQNGFNENTPSDSLEDWMAQFMAVNYGISNFDELEENDTFQQGIEQSQNEFTVDNYVNAINEDLASGLISNEAHDYIMDVVAAVNVVGADSLPTTEEIQTKIAAVNNIESSVLSSGMTENDKQYVLMQTSVCRHSLSFWFNFTFGSQTGMSTLSVNNNNRKIYLTSAELNIIAFADARGVQMAVSTGAVEWATLWGGGASRWCSCISGVCSSIFWFSIL